MKKISLVSVSLIICSFVFSACSGSISSSSDKSLLISDKTTQYFTDEAIPESDIVAIVNAGMNASSAMNNQDWHFSVVTNKELLNEFVENMSKNMPPQMKEQANPKSQFGDTPLAIIVSCGNKGEFDAGLAMQNIYDYAILSGYGAKIFTSPCKMLNDGYKEKLGVPSNMSVVATINIGKKKNMDGVDGVTSASTRKPYDEVVTRIE